MRAAPHWSWQHLQRFNIGCGDFVDCFRDAPVLDAPLSFTRSDDRLNGWATRLVTA